MTFIDGRSNGRTPDFSGIDKTKIANFIGGGVCGTIGSSNTNSMYAGTPKLSSEESVKAVNFDQTKLMAESNMIRMQLGV